MNKLSRVALIIILTLITIPISHAYYVPSSSQNSNFGNFSLPNPLMDFINSAKQIGVSVGSGISKNITTAPTGNLNILDWLDGANKWFYGLTGVSILGFLKGVLEIIIWILDKITALFKWLASAI